MEQLIEQYPHLFPAAFVVLWCFVLSMLSSLSGWSTLSDYYRDEGAFDGARRRFQSMSMGRSGLMDVDFSNCITVGADGAALRLSMLFPFRPFHAPLLIPLQDLSAERKKLVVFEFVRLRSTRAPEIRLTISASLASWIERESGRPWIWLSAGAPLSASVETAA